MDTAHVQKLRLGVLIAAALLLAEGVWSLQIAVQDRSLFMGTFAIGAFVTAAGLLKSQAWSRHGMYASAAWLLVTCTYYFGTAFMLGQFGALPMSVVSASLAPVLTLCVLAISSAEIVRRYFRAVSGLPAEHHLPRTLGAQLAT